MTSDALTARILKEGPRADGAPAFFVLLCRWLEEGGVPLFSAVQFIGTLHPQVRGLGCIWRRGVPPEERALPVGKLPDIWLNSPLHTVFDGGADEIRIDMATVSPGSGEILETLRRDGATDYLALLLPFSDGRRNVLGLATDAAGGFMPAQVGLFRHLIGALSLVNELLEQRRLTATLVDTYLGHGPGRAVLAGAIHRGDHHHIDAVLLLVDLRDSTRLGDTLPEAALLRTYDDYFRVVVEGIEGQGGDVLKFMGDGILAIFPVEDAEALGVVCQAAMQAVRRIERDIAAGNEDRRDRGEPQLEFVAALHVGRVLYGNIGSVDRLDFTVVGPAVNLAARFETLGKTLDQRVIATKSFAAASGLPMRSLGRHPLHGLPVPIEAFAPIPAAQVGAVAA